MYDWQKTKSITEAYSNMYAKKGSAVNESIEDSVTDNSDTSTSKHQKVIDYVEENRPSTSTTVLGERAGVDIEIDRSGDVNYGFMAPGWWFDTRSQLEAAAILPNTTLNLGDRILNTPADDITDDDIIEALYWLTGGNAFWKADERFGGRWDDCTTPIFSECKDLVRNAVSSANIFGELIAACKGLKEDDYFMQTWYEAADGVVEDEDEEYEEDEDIDDGTSSKPTQQEQI